MATPDTNYHSVEVPRGQEGLLELGGKTYRARLITSGEFDPREDLRAGHRVFTAGSSSEPMYIYGATNVREHPTAIYSTHHVSIKEAVLEGEEVVLQDHSLTFLMVDPFTGAKGFYWAPPCEDKQLDKASIAINERLESGNYHGEPYETYARQILVLEDEVAGDTAGQVFSPDEIGIVWFLGELFDEAGHASYEDAWEQIMRSEDVQHAAISRRFAAEAAEIAAAKKSAIEGAVGRD